MSKIYTSDDREYYEKIAPYGHRETLAEVEKWKKKFKKEKIPWTYGTSVKDLSTDELYFLCIDIHHEYSRLKKGKEKKAKKKADEKNKGK